MNKIKLYKKAGEKMSSTSNSLSEKVKLILIARKTFGFYIFFFVIATIAGYFIHWPPYDWLTTYRSSILAILSNKNPYGPSGPGLFTPPWFLFILIPIAILPAKLSSAVMFACGIVSLFWISRKLGANLITTIFFLLSYPVVTLYVHRQLEWLVLLGYFLPPQIGLFLVLGKPQAGIGIALYWLVEGYQKGRIYEVFKRFAPVLIAFLISYFIYGPYLSGGLKMVGKSYDESLWPYSIPIGIYLLFTSIRTHKSQLSISVSPLFSPYLAGYTWTVGLVGLISNNIEFILVCISTWAIYLFRYPSVF